MCMGNSASKYVEIKVKVHVKIRSSTVMSDVAVL